MTPLLACLLLSFPMHPLAVPALTVPVAAPQASVLHPHLPREVSVRLSRSHKISVSHLTVTFNKKGFKDAKEGFSWHLANSHLETNQVLTVGGQTLKAGKYALKARKSKTGAWELVLDTEGRFKAKISDKALPLKTEWSAKAPLREHLQIDFTPTGDESEPKLWLTVHFDNYLARALIKHK